ncbi:very short patch repair endonuclease [Planococcus ruber]|uniref:very short patch repair endonuclease n=1 Tax=Planococcus ruber TaxID=2027871 RepID=UPI001FEDC824|nr:very short patch repair endonuclease [Planococcus ruber]MCJ1907736.1 very short patch repair endonuclease [Planococcus ruber]
MPDNMSKENRRKTMQAIRSQSKLENIFTKSLWNKGIRFRKNVKKLKGKPDIAIQKYKIVIFIDSCFWHACPIHFIRPKSNLEYWDKKIHRNQERDKEINQFYIEKGWHIKRIWEHEIKKNLDETVEEVVTFINQVKNDNTSSPL